MTYTLGGKIDTVSTCNNCGAPKATDRYRACDACRAEWRRYRRKPGGPAETIETLRAELAKAQARIAELERTR